MNGLISRKNRIGVIDIGASPIKYTKQYMIVINVALSSLFDNMISFFVELLLLAKLYKKMVY
jgi:hypothetical protein